MITAPNRLGQKRIQRRPDQGRGLADLGDLDQRAERPERHAGLRRGADHPHRARLAEFGGDLLGQRRLADAVRAEQGDPAVSVEFFDRAVHG